MSFLRQRFPVTDSGRTGLLLIKRCVIQFSGSEVVTGFFKEMKLEKSLKSKFFKNNVKKGLCFSSGN